MVTQVIYPCQDGDDPDLFFREDKGSIAEAKSKCAKCPLMRDCLEFAMANYEQGTWGGTTEGERQELRAAAKRSPRTSRAPSRRVLRIQMGSAA